MAIPDPTRRGFLAQSAGAGVAAPALLGRTRPAGDQLWAFDEFEQPAVSTWRPPDDSDQVPRVLVTDEAASTGVAVLNGRSGEERWRYRPPDGVSLRDGRELGGTVYYPAADSGGLYAIDPGAETQLWTADLGSEPVGRRLYFDGERGHLMVETKGRRALTALDTQSGERVWTYADFPGQFEDVFFDHEVGDVLVSIPDLDAVHLLDGDSGRRQWTAELPEGVSTDPDDPQLWTRMTSDWVIVTKESGYVFDRTAGEVLTEFGADASEVESPVPLDDAIYYDADETSLVKYDVTEGTELWQFSPGGQLTSDIRTEVLREDGQCYAAMYDGPEEGTLYAVDADTGSPRWSVSLPGDGFPDTISWRSGTVYGFQGKALAAYEPETGDRRWQRSLVGELGYPRPVSGRVFVGTDGGHLYSLDAASGETVWEFTAPDGYGAIDHRLMLEPSLDLLVAYPGFDASGTTVYGIQAQASPTTEGTDQPAEGLRFLALPVAIIVALLAGLAVLFRRRRSDADPSDPDEHHRRR